jgi:hypothetical protein
LARQPRHLPVAHAADIQEIVERAGNPPAHIVLPVQPEREAMQLEARGVMRLQHFRDQEGGGVMVKIGGVITDAYFFARFAPEDRSQRRAFGTFGSRVNSGR